MRLDLDRVHRARTRIDPVFLDTPQYECAALGERLGCRLVLKVETLNPVRSFKGRGTETVLTGLQERGATAVVCASAGNLGQALAYGARRRGLEVTVVASRRASPLKLERTRALGGRVVLVDGDIDDALAAAARHAQTTGAVLVQDSLDLDTCEGAATIGVELSALPGPLDVVLVSLGAGAMASGVGFALQRLRPGVRTVTVQPEQAPAATLALRAGHPVEVGAPDTVADGVAGRSVIPEVLADLREVVADTVLVSEAAIVEAVRLLLVHAGVVVEPAGALGVAAVLEGGGRFDGATVATILCGGNLAAEDLRSWALPPGGGGVRGGSPTARPGA